MNCEQCDAKCCKDMFIPFPKITNDTRRWIELHKGLSVVLIKGLGFIKVEIPCSKLINNKCSIYEDRPDNCRNYECKDNEDFL